jgi:hypothetical protein
VRPSLTVLLGATALATVLAGCGGSQGAAGDPCTTSADCDPGLLCDTTQSPAICQTMLTPMPDLSGTVAHDLSAAVEDLAGADLTGVDLKKVD